MPAETATLTPDDLLDLPQPVYGKHYELSDGELIVVGNAGSLHELIKTVILEALIGYQIKTGSGRAFSESQFTLRADRARIPNVAWISKERLTQIPRRNKAIPIAPDIAVEIISDSERRNESERKLRDYMEAGVEVWQIFPATSSITVWSGNQGRRIEGGQPVTSAKLPGFSVPASEFFRE